MRRYVYVLLVVALLAASLPGITTSFAKSGGEETLPIPIYLKAYTFTPAEKQLPALPDDLAIDQFGPGENGYYIMQFRGPVEESWKARFEAMGVEFLEYIPDFAFKVRMNADLVSEVGVAPQVNWLGVFQPAYKIAPA